MSRVNEIFLDEGRAILVEKVAAVVGQNTPEEAFAAWLLPEQIEGLTIQNCARLATALHTGAGRSYRHIAILGFASAVCSLESDQQHVLQTGLNWLAGREPFLDHYPMSFCMDAVALLGIALGAKSIAEEAIKRSIAIWMSKFISNSYIRLQGWQKCLLAAAQKEVSASPDLPIPNEPTCADSRVALLSKGLLPERGITEEDEYQTLVLVKTDSNARCDPALAALRLAAFDWVRRSTPIITPGRVTVLQIAEMLRHVPFALRRWTWEDKPRTSRQGAQARKWHIDNEYHVQNLLWTLLAPIFPDLNDEEYVPGVGPLHPRTDLCIPSLKLIIEVKFMRASMRPQDLIEEIAADANLYLTSNSLYKSILVFIWDDTRRSEQHEFLIQGLKQLTGVIDAIVVSRPGIMEEEVRQA
jgi:hypothetical protein